MVFALHKGGDKTLDRIGGSTSEEFRILTEEEVLKFVRWDLFENTLVVCGLVVLSQGKQGVPIGGHLAAHIAEFWAMYSEHMTFSGESEVRGLRQDAWQHRVDGVKLPERVTVVLPGAESLVCFHWGAMHKLFEDVWASRDRFLTDTDRVRAQGLRGWWSPADRLLAWVSVGGQDVPVLGVVPWDSAPGGRVQHIVKRTPKRDKSRVLDFLSHFLPMEFILGELGSKFPQSEVRAPLVFLARFRDNVYIFLVNMTDALAAVIQPVIFELLRSMYQAQVPSVLQKSLWFALLWRDVYANFRSFLWGLGVHGYSHR